MTVTERGREEEGKKKAASNIVASPTRGKCIFLWQETSSISLLVTWLWFHMENAAVLMNKFVLVSINNNTMSSPGEIFFILLNE